jgi:hypothetical protein
MIRQYHGNIVISTAQAAKPTQINGMKFGPVAVSSNQDVKGRFA